MFAAVMGLLPAIERLLKNILKNYENILVKHITILAVSLSWT